MKKKTVIFDYPKLDDLLRRRAGTIENFFRQYGLARQGYHQTKTKIPLPFTPGIRKIIKTLGLSKKQICDLLIEKE